MCCHPYLDRGRPAKQKGGTIIARHIRTLEEHEAALADPDAGERDEGLDRRCQETAESEGDGGPRGSTTEFDVSFWN